jgi:ribosomal protein S27E
MELSNKMSYISGLIEGLQIDEKTKEGKVLLQMAELLKAVVSEVESLNEKVENIAELADDIDYDLGELEEAVYEILDGECGCGCEDDDEGDEDFDPDFFDRMMDDEDNEKINGQVYEIECPKCKKEIILDEKQIEKGSIACPECSELLEFDIDE